jgi:t-SNARE complex subunit (syntaxin)
MEATFENSSLQLAIVEERNTAYKQIESDITELSEIQQGLTSLIKKQGEELDVAERQIESAFILGEDGVNSLVEAEKYQETLRRRKFYFGAGILGFLAVGAGWIYSSTKSNREKDL